MSTAQKFVAVVHDRMTGQHHAIPIDAAAPGYVPELAAREAEHRGMHHADVLTWEPRDSLREAWTLFKQANTGMPGDMQQAFLKSRVAQAPHRTKVPRVRVGVDAGAPESERTVFYTGRRAGKTFLQELAGEWLRDPTAKVSPESTPYYEWLTSEDAARKALRASAADLAGKGADKVILDDVVKEDPNEAMKRRDQAGYRPVRELPKRLREMGYTEEGLDRDNPYTQHITPPGLMALSPMDGRLGNRWSPE